ncbi:hypothetical protein HN51_047812, partial [Arachis hypogaea]
DGSLGEIPSSDHEYIVGKKDLCEVLDEGISCDGNCSDVKTNCGPFIDFFGEKDAGVPGLDDISRKVDIMKEKAKLLMIVYLLMRSATSTLRKYFLLFLMNPLFM